MYRALLLIGMKYYCTKWQRRYKFSVPSHIRKMAHFTIHFNEAKKFQMFFFQGWIFNNETSLQIVISARIPLLPHLCVNFLKNYRRLYFSDYQFEVAYGLASFLGIAHKGVWRANCTTLLCLIALVSSASGNATRFQLFQTPNKSQIKVTDGFTTPVQYQLQ